MSSRVAPAGTHLPAEVTDLVAAWAPGRRWFPGGHTGRPVPWLEVTIDPGSVPAPVELPGPTGLLAPVTSASSADRVEGDSDTVVLALLRLGETVLHLPLVLTQDAGPDAGPGYIGTAGGLAVYDGGAHPAAWHALLRAVGITAPDVTGGRPLTGEQSNTSVVLPQVRPTGAPHGAMLKILRTVTPGEHPDVTVPQALTAAGFTGTPRFLGAADVPLDDAPVHLAILAALVPDAHDGFEHACDYAARGESFDALAAELGAVVARLHTALRTALPSQARLEPEAFVTGLRRRAAAAIEAAPALAQHADAVGRVLDDLQERLTAIPLQRIHGDLHLGQALYGATGWQLLDFEGEPQRPVAERTAPDLPVRDVAGMLRSFDYAAAVGGADDPTWAESAQEAFVAAYRAEAGDGLDDAVLRALMLDKALYEVVYETRQRPHWVHIPLAAVERLVGNVADD